MTEHEFAKTYSFLSLEERRMVDSFLEFLKQKHVPSTPDAAAKNASKRILLRQKSLSDFFMDSPLAGTEIDMSRMKGAFRKVEL